MPSDDLLSPSMFQCTLDETGVDGYRPAALRLLEAHDAALREQVRVLREALAEIVELDGKAWPSMRMARIATDAIAATAQEEKP
jgi:hypothetical protein